MAPARLGLQRGGGYDHETMQPRRPLWRACFPALAVAFCLTACNSDGHGGAAQGAVPTQISEQLQRYAQVFSFEGQLEPSESDRILGRLCDDTFRMSYSMPGDGEKPPTVLDMNFMVVLSLVHMMHEAARGDEPSLQDVVPAALSDAWVPFAKLQPKLRVAEVLRHYPAGESAYITVIHDLHEGMAGAPDGDAHHYETHLTWVKAEDGWRLQNKMWVDTSPE